MNILVVGASGFIGRLLVNHLAQGHMLRVLGHELKKLESIFQKISANQHGAT